MIHDIFIAADNDVVYPAAAKESDGTYLNSGTVTWTLRDDDLTLLATGSLSYESGSDGDYRGVIPSTTTTSLIDEELYYLDIAFSQTTYQDFWRLECRARYRN